MSRFWSYRTLFFSTCVFLLLLAPTSVALARSLNSPVQVSTDMYSKTSALTLSPSSGPASTWVVVSGTNFGRHEVVDVYFDKVDEALTTTNARGAFSVRIQIPDSAVQGKHWISAVSRHPHQHESHHQKYYSQAPFLVQGANWSQFHYGVSHTGFNPYENILNPSNVANLKLAWTRPLGVGMRSSPTVYNGLVYASAFTGTSQSTFDAYNASTGAIVWSAPIEGGLSTAAAEANGVVYVGTTYGEFYAYNALTGALLWSTEPQPRLGSIYTAPVVVNGIVYIDANYGNIESNLFAYDALTGKLLWSVKAAGPGTSASPTVVNGILYLDSLNAELRAYNAQTGAFLWSSVDSFSSPAVVDGVAYVSTYDKHLDALNAQTGKILWSTAISGIKGAIAVPSPAVANGVVYIGSDDGNLYAFSTQTGKLLWYAATKYSIESSAAVANGVVYVGSEDHSVYAFDALTGKQLWSAATGNSIQSSPAVVNGMVYIGSADGSLYAYTLPTVAQTQAKSATPPVPASLIPDSKLKARS